MFKPQDTSPGFERLAQQLLRFNVMMFGGQRCSESVCERQRVGMVWAEDVPANIQRVAIQLFSPSEAAFVE